jgi:hypothetical protein
VGLSIKHRAAVVLKDALTAYIAKHHVLIRANKKASEEIAGEMVGGLSAVCAMLVTSGMGRKDEVHAAIVKCFTESLDRDVKLLERPTVIRVD